MVATARRGSVWAAVLVLIWCGVADVGAQCEPIESAKMFPGDAARQAGFGRGVAIDGDLAVVGAWNDGNTSPPGGIFVDGPGAAYIYRRVSPGKWVEEAKLTAIDGQESDWLGYSVAISGDTVVLGAINVNTPLENTGAAYVFRFDGQDWVQEAELLAADRERDDQFGYAVGISGDVIVVGAPQNSITAVGKAYVFRRSGAKWVEEAQLIPGDLVKNDELGGAVAVSGDVAIIGAWNHGNRGSIPDGTGAAYVYRFDAQTEDWVFEEKLVSTETVFGDRDRFGVSIALEDDVALIGTNPARLDGNPPHSGCYVFRFDETSWVADRKLVPPVSYVRGFGLGVALRGNGVLIGAPFDWTTDDPCPFPRTCPAGSAFLYRYAQAAWELEAKLIPADIAIGDLFGESLGLGDGLALIGARRADVVDEDSGAVYLYDLNCKPTLNSLGSCPGVMRFEVEGATANERVMFVYAFGEGSITIPEGNPCAGTVLGLNGSARLAGIDRADGNGLAELRVKVPAAACGRVFLQAVDMASCETTNVILVD